MRIRRVMAWTAGSIATVTAVVVIVGALLPVNHRAMGRSAIAASPADVHALVSTVERYPSWRTGIDSVVVLGRSPLRFREHGADGAISYVVDESVPGQRFVTRIDDRDLPFGGRWIFSMRASGGGTELQIVEEGEVYNPVFRFVSRFVMGHTAGIDRYLGDVSRRLGGSGPRS